jgi:predicted AAA+ superfamily ATPase
LPQWKGYDPALELATHVHTTPESHDALSYAEVEHLRRREQSRVDAIVSGHETGHYFLLMGPKGTGKSTMILEAMKAIEAEGVSLCEAHPDLEVFRLRLGKSLNFEYNEDTQTVCPTSP